MSYIVAYVTTPDFETAERLANLLVENKLAACVNIVKDIKSVYFWQGNIEREPECLMIIKTREDVFEELVEKVKENHPYSVPEIIAMPIVKGSQDYLKWIDETLSR